MLPSPREAFLREQFQWTPSYTAASTDAAVHSIEYPTIEANRGDRFPLRHPMGNFGGTWRAMIDDSWHAYRRSGVRVCSSRSPPGTHRGIQSNGTATIMNRSCSNVKHSARFSITRISSLRLGQAVAAGGIALDCQLWTVIGRRSAPHVALCASLRPTCLPSPHAPPGPRPRIPGQASPVDRGGRGDLHCRRARAIVA